MSGITWDDIIIVSEQLSACNSDIIGLELGYEDLFLISSQKGLTMLDPDTDESIVDDERWEEMFQFFRRLDRSPGVAVFGLSKAGQPAMAATSMKRTGIMGTTISEDGKWGAVSYPVFADAPGIGPVPTGLVTVINAKNEHNTEAAFHIATQLISKEYQQAIDMSKGNSIYGTTRNDPETWEKDGQSSHMIRESEDAMHLNKPASIEGISEYEGYVGDIRNLFVAAVKSDGPLQPYLQRLKDSIDINIQRVKGELREVEMISRGEIQ